MLKLEINILDEKGKMITEIRTTNGGYETTIHERSIALILSEVVINKLHKLKELDIVDLIKMAKQSKDNLEKHNTKFGKTPFESELSKDKNSDFDDVINLPKSTNRLFPDV